MKLAGYRLNLETWKSNNPCQVVAHCSERYELISDFRDAAIITFYKENGERQEKRTEQKEDSTWLVSDVGTIRTVPQILQNDDSAKGKSTDMPIMYDQRYSQ